MPAQIEQVQDKYSYANLAFIYIFFSDDSLGS